jgi:broad specificity phosphatase PhoE
MNMADVKVVHFIRHGEAEHNVAARRHGCQEFRNWAYLDAPLTVKGRGPAREAQKVVLAQMKPQVVLVSPLTRTLQTAEEVFQPLMDSSEGKPRFEVCEGVRERIGHHPCDKRRTVSELKPQFPQFSFDAILDEDDCLWSEAREPTEDILQRATAFLEVLQQRSENCIGVVSHSAFLTAMFVVLTTECGLRSDGPDGPPDITSASSPDAVANGGPMNGESKPYFANGEVKTVVILPHSS